MIGRVLQAGFAFANRHIGLVILDMLWKTVWLAATCGMVALSLSWFASLLQSVQWEGTGFPPVDGLLLSTLLRGIWDENANTLALLFYAIAVISFLLWLFLEAFCRSRIFAAWAGGGTVQVRQEGGWRNGTNQADSTQHDSRRAADPADVIGPATFRIFLTSSFLKIAVLVSMTLLLGTIVLGRYLHTPVAEWRDLWLDTRGALVVSIVILGFLSFLALTVETLLRTRSMDLLGRNLLGVSAVIGTLVSFEVLMAGSTLIALVAATLSVSRLEELIAVLLLAFFAFVFLSFLHSYLLLVRFSAVGIMRHDVVDI